MQDKNKENNQEIDNQIMGYKDVYGVSTRKLNFGLWFIEHKVKLKAVIIIILILFSAATWTYSMFSLFQYLEKGKAEDAKLLSDLLVSGLASHDQLKIFSASPLSILEYNYFHNSSNKLDLYAKIINPNFDYSATLNYCFYSNVNPLKCGSGFVLPGEEKYLLELNVENKNILQNLRFEIKSVTWTGINKHEIKNWEIYKNQRYNFSIKDIKIGAQAGNENYPGFFDLNFFILNNSAFSYNQVPINIFFFRGASLFAINRIILEDFKYAEEKFVSLLLPDGQSLASQIKVVPDLNILDEDIYRKPANESGYVK